MPFPYTDRRIVWGKHEFGRCGIRNNSREVVNVAVAGGEERHFIFIKLDYSREFSFLNLISALQ